jgi:hypothetical protein
MEKIELVLKRTKKTDTVGTVSWVLAQLKSFNLSIETTETGRLSVMCDNQIIAQELKWGENKDKFERIRYCYYREGLKLIDYYHSYAYNVAIATISEQEPAQGGNALFGRVLTRAAEKVVYRFLEKCGDALFQAILEREDAEQKEIEKLEFEIREKNSN